MKQHASTVLKAIIRPALAELARSSPVLSSPAAEELILGTAAHESGGFRYVLQAKGPARSMWQIEPASFADVVKWAEASKPELMDRVWKLAWPGQQLLEQYAWNHQLAAAMARLFYLRVPAPLPQAGDIAGQAAYWKRHYNTSAGRGTVDKYLADWNTYVV